MKQCTAGYQVVWIAGVLEPVAEAIAALAVGEQDGKGEVRGALDGLLVEAQLQPVDPGQPLAVGADRRAARDEVVRQALAGGSARARRGARRGGS